MDWKQRKKLDIENGNFRGITDHSNSDNNTGHEYGCHENVGQDWFGRKLSTNNISGGIWLCIN